MLTVPFLLLAVRGPTQMAGDVQLSKGFIPLNAANLATFRGMIISVTLSTYLENMSLHIFDTSFSADRLQSATNALQQLSFGVNGAIAVRQAIITALFDERKDVTVEYGKGFIVTSVSISPKKSLYDVGSLVIKAE